MISGVGNGPFFLMKVLITRNVAVKGQHFGEGETHDLDEVDANYLIRNGKATEAIEAPACPPTPPKPKKVKASVDSD